MPHNKIKILITRSQKKSDQCAGLFPRYEYEPVVYSCIHYQASNALKKFLTHYDVNSADNWVFVSPAAVEYFAREPNAKDILASVENIFAIGESTAKIIQTYFNRKVIYPAKSNSENFISLPQLKAIINKRFYVARAQSGRDKIHSFLSEMGANVEYVETYHTIFVTQEEISHMINIIKERGINCVVITSFELFKLIVRQLEQTGNLVFAQQLTITVVNKRMYNWAIEKGFANIIELPAVDNQSIVRSVTNYYKGSLHV